MDPITIALICAASFGTVVIIIAFFRQLLISRDKKLNDEAQSRALAQEAAELEKLRAQMQSNTRFEAHYQVLGANKDAIKYLDKQIEEVLSKKMELVNRYSTLILKESDQIISTSKILAVRKEAYDKLRNQIDAKMKTYDTELNELQTTRSTLWDSHFDFQKHLLSQELTRNAHLDALFIKHSAILEKLFLRHIDNMQNIATKGMDTGALTFKDMLKAPIQFLMQFFGRGVPGVSFVQTNVEAAARTDVARAEEELNAPRLDAYNTGQSPLFATSHSIEEERCSCASPSLSLI